MFTDDIDDVVQEAFARIIRIMSEDVEIFSVKAVLKIVKRKCVDCTERTGILESVWRQRTARSPRRSCWVYPRMWQVVLDRERYARFGALSLKPVGEM